MIETRYERGVVARSVSCHGSAAILSSDMVRWVPCALRWLPRCATADRPRRPCRVRHRRTHTDRDSGPTGDGARLALRRIFNTHTPLCSCLPAPRSCRSCGLPSAALPCGADHQLQCHCVIIVTVRPAASGGDGFPRLPPSPLLSSLPSPRLYWPPFCYAAPLLQQQLLSYCERASPSQGCSAWSWLSQLIIVWYAYRQTEVGEEAEGEGRWE